MIKGINSHRGGVSMNDLRKLWGGVIHSIPRRGMMVILWGFLVAIALRQAYALGQHYHARSRASEAEELALIRTQGEAIYWNEQAEKYVHQGPLHKVFECYSKSIELNPREPVFYVNLGNSFCIYRRDAMRFYSLTEPEVFDRALLLYDKALQLDPTNFNLAVDIALTYYLIKPRRPQAARSSWRKALLIATNDVQRQQVYVHLARIDINLGRYQDGWQRLQLVTDPSHAEMKNILLRRVAEANHPQQVRW